jgi:MtN3 and saliva related transmembrane protein
MDAQVVATIGAILSMVSNIPQVYKVRTPNSTMDLHSYTVTLHFLSAFIWSVYGFMLNLYVLAIESGICGLLHLLILLAMYRDGNLCFNKQKIDYLSDIKTHKNEISVCKSKKERSIDPNDIQ